MLDTGCLHDKNISMQEYGGQRGGRIFALKGTYFQELTVLRYVVKLIPWPSLSD